MDKSNPYAAPMSVEADRAVSRTFRPATRSAAVARFFLSLCALVAIAATVSGLMQVQLLRDFARFGADVGAAKANDTREIVIARIHLLSHACTWVAFIVWFYRSHSNLRRLWYPHPKWQSGWAIGGWFIPVASLYIPCSVARELWNHSAPETLPDSERESARPNGRAASGVSLVGIWWAMFLLMNFISSFAGVTMASALASRSLDDLIGATWMQIVARAFTAAATIPALLMIGRITKNQIARRRQIESLEAIKVRDATNTTDFRWTEEDRVESVE